MIPHKNIIIIIICHNNLQCLRRSLYIRYTHSSCFSLIIVESWSCVVIKLVELGQNTYAMYSVQCSIVHVAHYIQHIAYIIYIYIGLCFRECVVICSLSTVSYVEHIIYCTMYIVHTAYIRAWIRRDIIYIQ